MEGDVAGVRIIPLLVEFKDTEVNSVQRMQITVKNVSKSSKNIRYYGPQTKYFVLKVTNPEKPVAPGLEIPAVIEYESREAIEHKDRLVLTVDDDVIEIPLNGYPCRPVLSVQDFIDFGHVVANSKVISKEIEIYNHGSKCGDFKLKYTGNKPIAVIPSSGTIHPASSQKVKVEYVTKQPGRFDEIVKVKLEGAEASCIRVCGTVVEGSLMLLSSDRDEPLECVRFGSTYYGTDRTECAVLFNNGPEAVCFVAVLDEEAIGQEVGVDLTKSTSATMLDKNSSQKNTGEVNNLTSLVTAIPNQGMLGPFEKINIFFRFSPRWNASQQGFRCNDSRPPRKDYALFVQIKILGASKGFLDNGSHDKSNVEGSALEVALTGTALPVMLTLSPQNKYDFGECPVGEHVDALCTLKNEASNMPVTFQFRRVAHFTARPSSGKIKPQQSQDVIFSFAPNQVGLFRPLEYLDVIGLVADNRNPFLMHLQVIHSLPIHFIGKSDPVTIKKNPVFNPGITPKITNEVGMYIESDVASAKKTPRSAMLNAQGTKLHRLKSSKDKTNEGDKALIAFPNDRAGSIRPSDRREKYKTIFMRAERHSYVDPDYAYTDDEAEAIKAHKEYYSDFIAYLRETRKNKLHAKEFQETNNPTDIAIKPAAGLRPKKIQLEEIKPDLKPPTPPNAAFKLLSTKQLASLEKNSAKKVRDGLNAVPTTKEEKLDCQKVLSPQQLHQIIIGPPTVDFGEVCLRSVSQKEVNIVNNLNQYIHVVVHIDCRELRQTSPLSQVVPPRSKAVLPLIFESNTKGRFQRSMDYTINGFYKNHVTVFAEIVPVALELSKDELVLETALGLPAEAGIRGVITLHNKLNHPAEFTWSPILGERGTAFSIRPATGVVEACKDLDCEVVFHPSFLAPEDGQFALQVHSGNTHKLKCLAKLGPTNVQFIDRRVMFGQVPLHMTTTRTAMIRNNSLNHAFFQVLDPNPFPGLSVSPLHGVVPVGGVAELKIHLTPNAVMKFDTRVQVAIRGWKTLELRMGGTVEPPCVDIDIPSFNLGGVYCGSGTVVPFGLLNRTNTKARMEFDLSRYADFALNFPTKQTAEDFTFQLMNPGVYSLSLEPNECVPGELIFKPTEVASYDFIIPVTINQTGAPTPSPTPMPPTPAPSNKNSLQHIVNPRPVHVTVATPRRKVIATALRQPLQISHTTLEFMLSPGVHEISTNSGIGHSKATMLVNNSDKTLKWAIDTSRGNQVLEDGSFKFLHSSGMPFLTHGEGGVSGTLDPGQTQSLGVLFCPSLPGQYQVTVPVILNDDYERPYMLLTLLGELKHAKLWFDPMAIVLTPVPLHTEITAEFQILAANYTKKSKIQAETMEVECEDGSKISPLTVHFPSGHEINACCGDEGQQEPFCLPCKIVFKSPKPVSFTHPLRFYDDEGNSFVLPVTATGDNCLLTCYPFLAQHRSDHQIVCEQGTSLKGHRTASRESDNVGEAVLIPCGDPQRPSSRPSTTATSSNFEVSSSSYESSSQSATDSTFPSTPRDGALNKFTTESEQQSRGRNGDLASRSLGSALFPEEDSEEGIFHTEVLMAVQRWFSSQGWPGGPHPITVPQSLRSGLSKKPSEEKTKNAKGGTWEANNLKKEFKTVYDMIAHLCGRPVPGIPLNNTLPTNPEERAKQVYWQHSTLLTFLKMQGACVASIKPEYLMEPAEYKTWVELQKQIQVKKNQSGHREAPTKTEEEETIEEQLFEAVSKRAWTDIQLQLLKTLVLAKVTPRQFKNLAVPRGKTQMPMVDPDPLCSNVYSISERIILLWLNHYYEQQRHIIWEGCQKGGIPPSRWVVNFDFDLLDGLVLAAAIGAHVPFVVKTHLQDMYTSPSTAEQCLHNALKVVHALQYIGVDYDIQAIDITDPNPISLLLLGLHLYNSLPLYLPRSNVEFVGALHAMVVRQVRLSNPSGKPLTYQAMLAGRDAQDFNLPKGNTVVLPPKSVINMSIEFTSRFLRPADAVLVLVGRRQGSHLGTTLVFNLRTQVDNITPKANIKCEAPCYELHKVPIEVTNPFPLGGSFHIILVESKEQLAGDQAAKSQSNMSVAKKKSRRTVSSKVDHGRRRPDTPPEVVLQREQEMAALKKQEEEAMKQQQQHLDEEVLSSFSCPEGTVDLEANGSGMIEVHFLPFQTGKRQASLIFVNDQIGEFLYSLDAMATSPLPAQLPFKPSTSSVRISSAAAAGGGGGMFGGDDSIVYWRTEVGQTLVEKLPIPVVNQARENALVIAGQQHMSDVELQRRRVTGTLDSATVTSKTVSLLSSAPPGGKKSKVKMSKFDVELSSELFSAPRTINIPTPTHRSPNAELAGRPASATSLGLTDEGMVQLPISFRATEPGHYRCRVTLKSQDDVRVYHIECTVTPEGSEASIEFSSPTHQAVTQDIPIVNETNHDWPLEASIRGAGFVGPNSLLAKSFTTTYYPLIFRPQYEGRVTGQLTLHNTSDNVDHRFHLEGKGERPLPLEQLVFHCHVKQSVTKKIQVPNITRKKLHYRVESDLAFITGPETVTVLAGKSTDYALTVSPNRRGTYKGIISFIADKNPVREVDSDGDEMPETEDADDLCGYRVWYSIETHVEPAPPQANLQIACACQKKAVLEVGLNNPTNEELVFEVIISPGNQGLRGPSTITLAPMERSVYQLQYAPAIVGVYNASVIFFNEVIGEFWYELTLTAETPKPTNLPHLECELGRWVRHNISLSNPTDETLQLIPVISNTNNFVLERDNERPLELRPHSSIKIPLTFMPSTLGLGDHKASITFHCEQYPELGEWLYYASGSGRLPQPQDPVSITAVAGSNNTLIIPFRNPLDHHVLVDVSLIDKHDATKAALDVEEVEGRESPFCLLLKYTQGMRLGPKSTIELPISFAPEDMRMFEALVTVSIRKEDNAPWRYNLTEESAHVPERCEQTDLHKIEWQYPIRGYPELTAPDTEPALVVCQARQRVEERVEVTLSGVAPAAAGPKRGIKTRAKTPGGDDKAVANKEEGIVVGEGIALAEEFTHELVFRDADSSKNLDTAVALSLVRQERDKHTGLVVLVFNVIYAPYKPMLHDVELLVKGATGGMWRFPLRFMATEPEPDDTLVIEAVGLNKVSAVGFRLTSQARHPVPYTAYFVAGSDSEFSVSPQSGELLPIGTKGTLIKVSFSPNKYGKVYNARMVVQIPDMQWTYNIKGTLPGYVPPRGLSSHPMAGPHPDPRKRGEKASYIRENLKLTTTAVSSPIKGAPIIQKTQGANA